MKKALLALLLLLTVYGGGACAEPAGDDPFASLPAAADPARADLAEARSIIEEYLNYGRGDALAADVGFAAINAWRERPEDYLNGSQLDNAAAPEVLDLEQPPLLYAIFEQVTQLGIYHSAAALSAVGADEGLLTSFGSFALANGGLLFPGPAGPLAVLGWLTGVYQPPDQGKTMYGEDELYALLAEIYNHRQADPAAFAGEAAPLLEQSSPEQAPVVTERLAQTIREQLRNAYLARLSTLSETLDSPVTVSIQETASGGRPLSYSGYTARLLNDGLPAAGLPVFVLSEQGACTLAFTVEQYLLAGGPDQLGLYAPGQTPPAAQAARMFRLSLIAGDNELSFSTSAPTLEELEGYYSAAMTLEDFYLAPELGDDLTARELAALGCDAALQDTLGQYVGNSYPIAVRITAQDAQQGRALLVNQYGAGYELPFSYGDGRMVFTDAAMKGLVVNGVWTPEWLTEGGIGFSGQLQADWPEHPEEFYCQLSFTAEPQH